MVYYLYSAYHEVVNIHVDKKRTYTHMVDYLCTYMFATTVSIGKPMQCQFLTYSSSQKKVMFHFCGTEDLFHFVSIFTTAQFKPYFPFLFLPSVPDSKHIQQENDQTSDSGINMIAMATQNASACFCWPYEASAGAKKTAAVYISYWLCLSSTGSFKVSLVHA